MFCLLEEDRNAFSRHRATAMRMRFAEGECAAPRTLRRAMRLRQDAARREFFFEVSRAAKPSTEVSSCTMSDRQATKAPKDLKSVGRSCCRRDACVGGDATGICCAAPVDHSLNPLGAAICCPEEVLDAGQKSADATCIGLQMIVHCTHSQHTLLRLSSFTLRP